MSCVETTSCAEGDHTYSWPCDRAPGTGCDAVGPLLREDFPSLPAGCVGWDVRSPSGRTTFFVTDSVNTDWPYLLEFLNRFPLPWQVSAAVAAS